MNAEKIVVTVVGRVVVTFPDGTQMGAPIKAEGADPDMVAALTKAARAAERTISNHVRKAT